MRQDSEKLAHQQKGPFLEALVTVGGIVQGVGFRPSVWRLAQDHGIVGSVKNDGEGVKIVAAGYSESLHQFITQLKTNTPPLARVDNVDVQLREPLGKSTDFKIIESAAGAIKTAVSPDKATCSDCITEITNPFDRRFRYPLTNCTNCGPRFSIIQKIPYDRKNTTMRSFSLCRECKDEYNDPTDRRFHAQPNACHKCGPEVSLERLDGRSICQETLSQLDAIDATCSLLQKGEIVIIKGLGGFHLACDATNNDAVAKLRRLKKRPAKPFALMVNDLTTLRRYTTINETEERLLKSPEAPIVLLRKGRNSPSGKKRQFGEEKGFRVEDLRPISKEIAPDTDELGFMLPYTPLHHLLLKRMKRPIVLTSANESNEPQCISNEEVQEKLSESVDFVLWHNRDIANRVDDSVARVTDGNETLLRRSRGFCPAPLPVPNGLSQSPDLLAMGGELKNTFCLKKATQLILSQHIGDLENPSTYIDYKKNLGLYTDIFDHSPSAIVVDGHPEYLSTKFGVDIAEKNSIPVIPVQHHHAHVASCMVENGWPSDGGKVLGIALDGLGYGDDGEFWGGEFLLADYSHYERLATFKPVPLLGGDQATKEPWRNTFAHLMAEIGWDRLKINYDDLELMRFLESKPLDTFTALLEKNINSPLASSCGRLFDAVAAAVGVCRENVTYEGQAAIKFESLIDQKVLNEEDDILAYPFAAPRLNKSNLPYIEPLAMWQALLGDLVLNTPAGTIAARFHKGLAKGIVAMVDRVSVRDEERITNTIALTGGVFQNKTLHRLVHRDLEARGYKCLIHSQVPANDGGLALGQVAVGLAKIKENEA